MSAEDQAELDRLTQLRPDEEEVVVIRLAKTKVGGMRLRIAPSKELVFGSLTDLQSVAMALRKVVNSVSPTRTDSRYFTARRP